MAAGSAAHGISKALELKAAGNEDFKRGDYKGAMGAYHSMFMCVIRPNRMAFTRHVHTAPPLS